MALAEWVSYLRPWQCNAHRKVPLSSACGERLRDDILLAKVVFRPPAANVFAMTSQGGNVFGETVV
jgi:hypothetical protein